MGDSMPPPATFDLVGSFARRRGADVEIVLSEPKTEVSGSPVVVTLAKAGRSIDASGDLADGASGRRLTVRAPRDRFTDGTWSLRLRNTSGTAEILDARLLVQGERPLVLLWGATDSPSIVPPRRVDQVKRTVVKSGGKALDRALSVLPDGQARRIRSQVRVVARRVLR